MSIQTKKRWTLIEHFRGLGIEPEAPFHPVWLDLEDHWDAEFKRDIALWAKLGKLGSLGLPAAPLVITLYKWAAANNVDMPPVEGTVNADPRVRQAMCEYATARVQWSDGYYQGMDYMLKLLVAQEVLPEKFANFLDYAFNQEIGANDSMTAWLAPLTGKCPTISTWKAMAKELNAHYRLKSDDLQVSSVHDTQQEHHWSKNHRMELVLAAWLETDSEYLTIPLYRHLPNISIDKPDQTTAVFWMVASQRVDKDPNGEESKILEAWMKQYPAYQAFFQRERGFVETLTGDDPVVCGKWLHQMWTKNHSTEVSTILLDGMLEP